MTSKSKSAVTISARKLSTLSKNVARHRKACGMTKTEFASNTSVSRDTIRRIETLPSGYVPSISSVEALANLAGTSVVNLLTKKLAFQ